MSEYLCQTRYLCYRCCKMDTLKYCNIKKHLLRKNLCKKKSDVILLSDDQLLVISILPYNNEEASQELKNLNHLSNSNLISKNKIDLFNEIDLIEKNKIKTCKYCSQEFNLISELKKHIISNCFYEELSKKNTDDNKVSKIEIVKDSYNNNITGDLINNNNCNITNNTNNNTNNITNNLYFNLPVPFEEEWDISEIDKTEKEGIMISQFVFSRFLSEILKNEKNSNVIIDKDNESGKVYMNHQNQYIEMSEKDILMKTMEKLYDQLYDLIENNKDSLKSVKEISKDYIHQKFSKYCKSTEKRNDINEVIVDTYDNNKTIAENKYNEVQDMNKKNIKAKNIHKIIKKNKIILDKTELKDKKVLLDNIMKARDEDLYYDYDSDGNTKI